MGTRVRDRDLQRLKANPPRNLHLEHRKPQPRAAWDRCLPKEGQMKPARGGCPHLGRVGSLPGTQVPLNHRAGHVLAAALWESDGFAFSGANPKLREFYSANPSGCPGAVGAGVEETAPGVWRRAEHPPSPLFSLERCCEEVRKLRISCPESAEPVPEGKLRAPGTVPVGAYGLGRVGGSSGCTQLKPREINGAF